MKKSIKLAQISDLHITKFGKIEKKVLKALEQEKPDIIVITGDIVSSRGNIQSYDLFLSKLKAPLGVYFIKGNWEYWEPVKELENLLRKNKIIFLVNKVQVINKDLNLVGLDDIEGNPDLSITDMLSAKTLNIGLYHSPIFFKEIPSTIQLSLAGHSHGGQVRLPIIGALWLPDGVGEFVQGWYKKNKSELYVNRGIGNSILPIRFNCRPEITIINIKY